MRLALLIVLMVSLLSFLVFYLTTDPDNEIRADMPWHINVLDPMHSKVFGIVLNQTSLEQAREHFGQLDGLALFLNPQGKYSLEAYFGKVTIGPFAARLIANLDVPQSTLETLTEHSIKRVKIENGSTKWTLNQQTQQQQGLHKIQSLTYIPSYSGMDAEYISQRFGQPDQKTTVDETTEMWFYPASGVKIMIDLDGKELFEYSAPAQFNPVMGEN